MPIETTVAYVWAIFMTLVTIVLSYFGIVVARRQDLESHRSAEESSTSASSADVPSAS